MNNAYIYVWKNQSYDLSRWLEIELGAGDFFSFRLAELCLPGRASELRSVQVPKLVVKSLMACGPVQVTTANGYCLIRRDADLISIEFRANSDTSPNRVAVLVADIKRRLDDIESFADQRSPQSHIGAW